MSGKQQIARAAKQGFSKIVACLQQQPKLFWKQLTQHLFSSCRRIDGVAAPAQSFGHYFNRCGNVAQKAGRQFCGGNRSDSLCESCFCLARLGRFAHDSDRGNVHG